MSNFADELQAIETLAQAVEKMRQVYKDADETRRLFLAAGYPVPEALRRLLGDGTADSENGEEDAPQESRIVTPVRPTRARATPPRPEGAEDSWIWIRASDVSTSTLALAILRSHGDPLLQDELFRLLKPYNSDVQPHIMWNIRSRLEDKINHGPNGWTLKDPQAAPMFYEDWIWGPVEVFTTRDAAEYRRQLILEALRGEPKGLTVMDIVRRLDYPNFCRVVAGKDSVATDMEVLQKQDKVRKVGQTKMWTLVPGK